MESAHEGLELVRLTHLPCQLWGREYLKYKKWQNAVNYEKIKWKIITSTPNLINAENLLYT